MTVTFLGTGTSQGVPFIGCDCDVCQSQNPKDSRLRCSIHIITKGKSIIIDTTPDFRYQMLRAHIKFIDAILFTHSHKDHVAGLDDIRAYNYWQNKAIDIYANSATLEQLKREFYYIFAEESYPGIPEINAHTITNDNFNINDLPIIPISTLHYKMEVFGYRIGDFTYITDTNFISEEEQEKIKGSKVLVLNALRHAPHISHFTLEEAIELGRKLEVPKIYFTHISHQLGLYNHINPSLPEGMELAYDGLTINL